MKKENISTMSFPTGRKKEVLCTVAANLLLQIATAVCGFVLPPLIIGTFGSSVNGMVASISQFIAYLNIVEAGVGGAAIAALYKPLARADTASRDGIISATVRMYNRSGMLFTVLIAVLAVVYPAAVGTQVNRTECALMVLVLGIGGAAEFFLIGKYRVLLTADKKTYVLSIIQTAAVILNTAVAVVLIKLNCGILTVKFVSALVYLSRYFAIALYVRKRYPGLNPNATPDTPAISQSKNVLLHQIGGLVVFNSPVVLITLFCTLKEASIYSLYAMVFTAVQNLLASFSNGMQSFFGESLAADSPGRTQKIFGAYETAFFAAEGWFYSMAYILIMPFMGLYTRNMSDAPYMQPDLALLFVLVGVLNNVRNPGVQLIGAAGHFKKTQWRSVAEAAINLVCSTAGIMLFGFRGVLLGSICSYSYRTADIIIYSSKHILEKLPYLTFIKITAVAAYNCALIRIFRHFPCPVVSYADWAAKALVYGAVLALPVLGIFIAKKAKTKFGRIK